MKLAIINYGSGNLHSVHKAFENANKALKDSYDINVTSDPKIVGQADKIVLPGVGAFADCKNSILNIPGMYDSLESSVIVKKVPFMGICVGMQLLAEQAEEFGNHEGFGWIQGSVVKINEQKDYKIPHMGWNEVNFKKHELFSNIEQKSDFYFVHSYHFKTADQDDTIAITKYPNEITAAVCKKNIFGTQFHPEKSHNNGAVIIQNFLQWNYS
jgi:glutamine amidotransferase